MSFGVEQHMVTSINNKSQLLNRKERFKKGMGLSSSELKKETSFSYVTPYEIKKQGQQHHSENKRQQLQTNVATVLFGVMLVMFFYLLLN